MPESPEVQAFVEFLAERATGRAITTIDVVDYRGLKTRRPDPDVLVGARVNAVLRWGKYVDIDAGEYHLVLSFGRHGWATWRDRGDAEPADEPPVVVRVRLDTGAGFDLTDAGGFRSAAVWIVPDPDAVPAIARLGADPVDATFTRGDFERAAGGRRKQLKALLQEQESIAGVGNAYSDEILHTACLSPMRHASTLTDAETARLFDALRDVLIGAVTARRGIPIDSLKAAKTESMRVHGRAGEACPVCGDEIRDLTYSGASAQYCPTCQNGGVPIEA